MRSLVAAALLLAVETTLPPVILEDFEDIGDVRVSATRATATFTAATERVHSGRRSGQLAFDFKVENAAGTAAASARHRPAIKIAGRPVRIGVWVYGDGSRHWLRGLYFDGNGVPKDVDFTAEPRPVPATKEDCRRRSGGINWTGWKYVQTDVPADAVLPLTWDRLSVIEPNDVCDAASAIHFDDLRAVYDPKEDLVGPEVSEMAPAPGGRVFIAKPEITALVTGGSSVAMTLDGEKVAAKYDAATGRVRFMPGAPLTAGEHRVRLEAKDRAGNAANPAGEWTFVVYTGADGDAPVIDRMQPLDGTRSRAGRPRVSARIRDEHRGVDPASIEMTVDGAKVIVVWDKEAGVVWHAPAAPLPNGRHEVKLRVADRAKNIASASWSFTVDAVPQPTGAFRFTWIADGGYFEGAKETEATRVLAQHLALEKADPPSLLLFGGDIVENDQQANYDRALAALHSLGAPFFVAAGNHEISGTLSRERFWRTFGPTVAAIDYGTVDFLLVDVANSEFAAWDTSQFAWLEEELKRTTAKTLFLILHAPTRDPFDSGHGIPRPEGLRIEKLLAASKRKIVVFSGDAHAYGRWTRDGVEYVISGGGGGGLDAAPANGGFFHRLHIAVDAAGSAKIEVVRLSSE